MADVMEIPLLDHELADDELRWVERVYRDFAAARETAAEPREALREVLGRAEHALPTPIDLSGDGVWRNGRNAHGRGVAAVFLNHVELHKHAKSRTDQFAMYVNGEADAFSVDDLGRPRLRAVSGGDHFHNTPGAPHAFLPKVGKPIPDDWQIAFLAITPRNLQEDTQKVSDETKTAYEQVVGRPAPTRV
jgi:hypothetical protein